MIILLVRNKQEMGETRQETRREPSIYYVLFFIYKKYTFCVFILMPLLKWFYLGCWWVCSTENLKMVINCDPL